MLTLLSKLRRRFAQRLADWRLERDARFLAHVAQARQSLRDGRGIRLEDLEP